MYQEQPELWSVRILFWATIVFTMLFIISVVWFFRRYPDQSLRSVTSPHFRDEGTVNILRFSLGMLVMSIGTSAMTICALMSLTRELSYRTMAGLLF